jgi:hypothetical protein
MQCEDSNSIKVSKMSNISVKIVFSRVCIWSFRAPLEPLVIDSRTCVFIITHLQKPKKSLDMRTKTFQASPLCNKFWFEILVLPQSDFKGVTEFLIYKVMASSDIS